MTRVALLTLFTAAMTAATVGQADAVTPAYQWAPSVASVQASMDSVHQANADLTPGMCIGAIDGLTSTIKCYGSAGPGKPKPDANTLWSLGSITKTLTATLLDLRTTSPNPAAAKSIALSDPVKKFIAPADGKVNIPDSVRLLDLAQHYSGLPHSLAPVLWSAIGDEHDMNRTFSECFTGENGCETVNTPSKPWNYSNLGFDWLGNIVARNDGFQWGGDRTPWERDLTANVLTPLGMNDTRGQDAWNAPAHVSDWSVRSANGSLEDGNTFTWLDDEFMAGGFFDAPGGGGRELWSSASDVMKWMQFSRGKATNAPANLQATLPDLWQGSSFPQRPVNASTRMGLAWNIKPANPSTGQPLQVSKSGLTIGFNSFMGFEGDADRATFVLTNTVSQDSGGDLTANAAFVVGCGVLRSMPPAQPGLRCPSPE
jgi:CubicO group peptidase (beta-lactamase class C family)